LADTVRHIQLINGCEHIHNCQMNVWPNDIPVEGWAGRGHHARGEDPALQVCHLAGHAHSLLFYYPTDLYVDSVPYLDGAQKARIREWMGDGIVRASIGLENVQDLIADLDQGLRGRMLKGLVGPLAYRLMT
jgi:hypothetical protein